MKKIDIVCVCVCLTYKHVESTQQNVCQPMEEKNKSETIRRFEVELMLTWLVTGVFPLKTGIRVSTVSYYIHTHRTY